MWSEWQTWKMARRVVGLLVGLLLAAAPAAVADPFSSPSLSDPDPLSNGGEASTPAVAVSSSGQVYVAWNDGTRILFTRPRTTEGSCETGLKFETPVSLSTGTGGVASLPAVAANGNGGVFVAWQVDDFDFPANAGIYFRRSIDGGRTFLPALTERAVKLQTGPIATFPSVAADDAGGVYVAWQDKDFTNLAAAKASVRLAQSLMGGGFSYADVFTANGFAALVAFFQPSVAVASDGSSDGSKVHVVWNGSGVRYKGFAPGTPPPSGDGVLLSLSGASTTSPKIAVHETQVAAAWLEGTPFVGPMSLKARKATSGTFDLLVAPDTIYPSPNALSALSLSFGGRGRFFAWQEGGSVRLSLETDGGTVPSGLTAINPAAPSVGQDGTGRLVATWQETRTTTETRLAYQGGSSSSQGSLKATASHDPKQVNRRTMAKGSPPRPNLTVFIEPAPGEEWSARDIILDSVRLNEQKPVGPSALVGNRLMVKFDRSYLQTGGGYTIKGNVNGKGDCSFSFSYSDSVDIVP